MAKHIEKPLAVTPDSDLMRLLDEADAGSPVLLERRGVVYRLTTTDVVKEPEKEWDAEAFRRHLDETLGSWADIDTDKLIEDIYRWRREGSRNPDEIVL